MIIGLSGYARSGKDTVADILVSNHGYRRVAFADKLRDVLYALNPMLGFEYTNFGGEWFHSATMDTIARVQDVIDVYGWNGYKETGYSDEIRELLQRLGTEAGRQVLGENTWVDAALTGIEPNDNVVITDARFPNEAQGVKDRGGVMWRVKRPDTGPINSHASETGLDDWNFDAWIVNNGTLDHLRDAVDYCVNRPLGSAQHIRYAKPITVKTGP